MGSHKVQTGEKDYLLPYLVRMPKVVKYNFDESSHVAA